MGLIMWIYITFVSYGAFDVFSKKRVNAGEGVCSNKGAVVQ